MGKKWCLTITYRCSKQPSPLPSFPLLFCFHGNNTSCIFNDERFSPSLSVSFSLCSLTILQEALNVYCILDRPTHSFMILIQCLVSITYLLRFHITSRRCHWSQRINGTHESIYIEFYCP